VLLAVLMAVGGIGFGVVQAVRGGSDGSSGAALPETLGRDGSEALPEGPPIDPDAPPLAYRITYRVEVPRTPATEERLTVLRPFGKRVDEGENREELTFGRRASRRAGNVTVFADPPTPTDVRLDVVVADAERLGVMERRERRRVLGRTCQVFRFGVSTTAAGFVPPTPAGDSTDVCVDGEGLVLERLETTEGRVFRRRVAIAIDVDGPVGDQDVTTLPLEPTQAAVNGGGSVRAVSSDSEPEGRFFLLDTPPAGYELRGRYSVVPPQGTLASPDTRNEAIATTDDVYVKDGDVIVVSRGGTLGQQAAFGLRPGSARADLGPTLGEGEIVLSLTGTEVRVPLDLGRFVRIYGTVPVDQLVSVARALRETPGGSGLVFVD
jgi:hypothetical protein